MLHEVIHPYSAHMVAGADIAVTWSRNWSCETWSGRIVSAPGGIFRNSFAVAYSNVDGRWPFPPTDTQVVVRRLAWDQSCVMSAFIGLRFRHMFIENKVEKSRIGTVVGIRHFGDGLIVRYDNFVDCFDFPQSDVQTVSIRVFERPVVDVGRQNRVRRRPRFLHTLQVVRLLRSVRVASQLLSMHH